MNKYKSQSKQARKRYRIWKSCERKVAFESEELARQKGQEHYHCPNCHKWHRSGAFAKLVAKAKGVR